MARQRYFYHAAPVEVRSSILETGLSPGKAASYGPPAVYVFRHRLFAENYISDVLLDVWKVDLRGYDIHADPEDPSEAAYVEMAVSAARLEFSGTFVNGEEVVSA